MQCQRFGSCGWIPNRPSASFIWVQAQAKYWALNTFSCLTSCQTFLFHLCSLITLRLVSTRLVLPPRPQSINQ